MKLAHLKNWLEVRPLDRKYLGQRLPGDPEERQKLLGFLREIVSEKGPDYVYENREILLESAKDILIDL